MAPLRTVLPPLLARERDIIRQHAVDMELDFFEVIFEVIDFQQMNEFAAYLGFPTRYPHWRWGMEYERLKKSYTYGLHKIYEMVINNDPSYAYLLDNNELVDQKIVMAHVYGHSDFFKSNLWFRHTNRKMMDQMANHATRVQRHIDRIGLEEVEEFIDTCLSLENLIDRHAPYIQRRPKLADAAEPDAEAARRHPEASRLRSNREYMDRFINPPEAMREEVERRREAEQHKQQRFPSEPERDVLLFLLEYAPLESWQQDILSIIRDEAYYFAPQGMTKIMNEGWACLAAGSLVSTSEGLLPIEQVVAQRSPLLVSDGEGAQTIYDWATFPDRETVWIRTASGLTVEGSVTHQLLLPDGSWRRLDALQLGDRVVVGAGAGLWPERPVSLLDAQEAAPSVAAAIRGGWGSNVALAPPTTLPTALDEALGALLGHLLVAGRVSRKGHGFALRAADEEGATTLAGVVQTVFGRTPRLLARGPHWHVRLASPTAQAFLERLGVADGHFPEAILRSPRAVVVAFLHGLFAGGAVVDGETLRLRPSSGTVAQSVQLLLLHFGILATQLQQRSGRWQLVISGTDLARFEAEIGLPPAMARQVSAIAITALDALPLGARDDQVVAIERRRGTVYDISVTTTHRYAAQGFINHNSFWHTTIMTQTGVMTDAEVVDYADHHSGTVAMSPQRINPYKIGLELFRDIEERWNKGRFGSAWDECDDMRARRSWDLATGLGRQKIFEVRSIYNDVGFIETFFTEDFCNRHQLFTYKYNERTGYYEIDSRDFQAIKQKLLFSLTNFGQPIIAVQDANYANRGELYLAHRHEGLDLKLDYARDTMTNLYRIWRRPVHVETVVEGTTRLLSFDGTEHSFKKIGAGKS